ncbi:helix-turn-helix transcriptional regulator [Nocardia wallacei]|uniref:helix-turn-helix transcriptional regulator n=1 Tax=Nocardia wallacei TaxID=480035 RepID=UPI002457EA07|nr:helix-turn-helix transcriptional regulator [Nocardia wallacei]
MPAALAFLRRGGVGRVRVAQLLAVLDQPTALWILARVLDAEPAVVRALVRDLTAANLVAYAQFRRRDVRDAVLREAPVAVRQRLHRRIAQVLEDGGAPAVRVADHLLGADDVRMPWAVPVLRAAAEDAIADDEIHRAIDYLELACRLSGDDADRAVMLMMLAMIRWRLNPSTSNRSFARLLVAVRGGAMPVACLPMAARYLLWHGRTGDAAVALRFLRAAARAGDETGVAGWSALREWLACHYPGLLDGAEDPARVAESDRAAAYLRSGWAESDADAARLLSDVFTHGACDHAMARAQRLVRAHRLDDTTFGALLMVLDGMVYSDRLDSAAIWCESLMLEAAARRAPAWQSIFAIWRSAMFVRAGALDAAIGHAGSALGRVRGESLGIYAGLAVAGLVEASTAAGRYREAAAYLDTELPDTVPLSRIGLHYLRARGRYRLALGEHEAALADFTLCGERMRRWRMDIPGIAAWRNDLAETYVAAGDMAAARRWAAAHVHHIRGATRHSSGATSLRLVAATSAPAQRVGLLRKATEIAGAGPDRLELATALADLAQAYLDIGERDRARTATRRALRLAEQCGAEPLRARLAGARAPGLHSVPPTDNPRGALDTLSPSELKVARLAAAGCRNRDIARDLHITTSTVEQHLTRVYRKLGVTRRTDLAVVLGGSEPERTEAV